MKDAKVINNDNALKIRILYLIIIKYKSSCSFYIFTKPISYVMKNFLKIAAWINGAIGVILILLGVIAVLAGDRFLGHFWANYFYPAYNFLLLGIFCFLAIIVGKEK